MLEVIGISAGYRDKLVLKDISFTLRRGDLLAVLGPNGAGKSTLLRVLSGVLRPSSGRVLFDGIDLLSLSPKERAKIVAVVPQGLSFDFPFSVEEAIAMGRYPFNGGKEEVERAIEKLDLQGLRKRKLCSLSGGEFKRVVIAKALAQTPKVLLLDEPLGYLDPKYQKLLISLCEELSSEGMIIISVVHDINIALKKAKLIMLLKEGKAIAFGTPERVLIPDLLKSVYEVELMKCERCGDFYFV